MKGIFTEEEREQHKQRELARHTDQYIQYYSTKLKHKNAAREYETRINNPRKEEDYNPLLMIGKIHDSQPRSIEEQLERKKGNVVAGRYQRKGDEVAKLDAVSKCNRIFQQFEDNQRLKSAEQGQHEVWEAKVALFKSKNVL